MLEQAGRLGPSVPIITARVASGSPLASLALSAGGAGCEQPASASASVGRRRAGRCRGRRVMAPKLAAAAAARNALRGEEIGRASCRERVCQYVWIPVVAGTLQKKK